MTSSWFLNIITEWILSFFFSVFLCLYVQVEHSMTFQGHSGAVSAVSCLGRFLDFYTISEDRSLRSWCWTERNTWYSAFIYCHKYIFYALHFMDIQIYNWSCCICIFKTKSSVFYCLVFDCCWIPASFKRWRNTLPKCLLFNIPTNLSEFVHVYRIILSIFH